MSGFGFGGGSNLPPGCSIGDIERAFGEDSPCDVCGGWPERDTEKGGCVCPPCPVCHQAGDPTCYKFFFLWSHMRYVKTPSKKSHGLSLNNEQHLSRAKRRIEEYKKQIEDEEQAVAYYTEKLKGESNGQT